VSRAEAPRGTVLIVEDDRSLREGLATNFAHRRWKVLAASDGKEGLAAALEQRPDLVVLDLMLPGLDGFEVLRELRRRGTEIPVLILTARGSMEDKLSGFGLGADDYVTKPFQLPELMARAEAMVRRSRRAEPRAVTFGDVTVDLEGRRVTRHGAEVALLAKEFDLLTLLASSPGRVLSREQILDGVWGWEFEGTARTVDNYIRSLRQKLEADPASPRHILTVRQVGYKLEP
jgi:DNA-binding response OmpR family regulator